MFELLVILPKLWIILLKSALIVSHAHQLSDYASFFLLFPLSLSFSRSSQALCCRTSIGFHGSGCSSVLRTRVSLLRGSSLPTEPGTTLRLCCSTISLWTACQSGAGPPHCTPPPSNTSKPSPSAPQDSDSHCESPREGGQSYK